jgi:histidinol-phosphatase
VLGEELGADGGGSDRWVIDPIDATRNYVRGIPIWATLIALEREGQPLLGVVSAPALRRRWWAARGQGAWLDGVPLAVSAVARVEDAIFCYTSARSFADHGLADRFLALARRSWSARGFGDFWQHMLVAEGCADFAVETQVEYWDVAAVRVIVEEAGGRLTDLRSGEGAVTSNGLLHDEVLAAFR